MKHTPGPWKKRHTPLLHNNDFWCIDWSEDQEEVCEGVYGEANANLIAFAPELLEALEKLLRAHRIARLPETHRESAIEMIRDAESSAEAAIKRAKGE